MTKKVIAIVFGVALIAAVAIAAATGGIGKGSVPKDDVAKVDGHAISQADFDRALAQTVAQQGQGQGAPTDCANPTVPAAGTPEYTQLRDAALGQLLDQAWIEGEAKDKGVEVSDRQIADQLATTKQQNFKTEAEFQKFVTSSCYTPEDINERIKLQLLSQDLEAKIREGVPKVSNSEAQDFYNQNKSQFEQPATRDIRLVLNKDTAKIDEAKKALEADPSDANWKKVAAEFSTDAATKDMGGVRAGITPGVLEGDLDSAVFKAPVNQIEGPVTTPLGTYIFEVTKDTPAAAQPFDQVSAQLIQQLQSQKEQEIFSTFIAAYRSKWTDVTICADGFVIDRCDNFNGATQLCPPKDIADMGDKAIEDYVKSTGCPPALNSRAPIAPGTGGGLGSSGGAPQGPHPPGSAATPPQGAVPGGAVPGAPPGAQGAPQGAPPGAAGAAGAPPAQAGPSG